jgi:FkbM family methyltransferase
VRLPFERTRALAALGAGVTGRIQIWRASGYLSLARRFSRLPRRWLPVTLNIRGSRFLVHLTDASDLMVLRDIFVIGEYEADYRPDPAVIVDLGSHAGLSVLFFRARFPGARIVAVEADPRTVRKLQRNVGHLEGVTVVHAAMGAVDGAATLLVGELSWASRRASGTVDGVVVPAMSLETLCRRLGIGRIDLLKIDVEGSEWEVLSACPERFDIGEIVGEVHDDLMPVSAAEFRDMLARRGFVAGRSMLPEPYLLHVRRIGGPQGADSGIPSG